MTDKNPLNSVPKEQFGKTEDIKEAGNAQEIGNDMPDSTEPTNGSELPNNEVIEEKETNKSNDVVSHSEEIVEKETTEKVSESTNSTEQEDSVKSESIETMDPTAEIEKTEVSEEIPEDSSELKEKTEVVEDVVVEDEVVEKETTEKVSESTTNSTEHEDTGKSESIETQDSTDVIDKTDVSEEIVEDSSELKEKTDVVEDKVLPPEDFNFSTQTKEELLDTLKVYLSTYSVDKIKRHVDQIKSCFYTIHNEEIESIKAHFLESGGQEQDFKVEESPIEITMKELLNEYREKRIALNKGHEEEKESNLRLKYQIINEINELINSQESLNKTFHDFRTLQEKWREIGPVPQSSVKPLWEKYHYHVEAFYDYIKINKELRDLDFKKNLESKLKLCEKAEELLLEPSVVEAFRNLQILHDQWREIGPVPADKRSELWERFKEATSKINHKHQEYFVNLKDKQKTNLEEKTVLCEKAEELAALLPKSAKEWEEKSKDLIELQKVWKTIGFAPKKYNTKIYERFRSACDVFFEKKREFFAQNREEQINNLQLKTELCIQAEAVAESTDWKKTTDELIKLQKKWKTIGPVPIKNSDKIWKRFRSACDTFFNNKSEFYSNIDSTYIDNLKAKEALIDEINDFVEGEDVSKNLKRLKDFQRKWSEIGFVPIKEKNTIQEKYRSAINAKFDALKLDEDNKSRLKFRSKIENMISKPNSDRRLSMERDKCFNKLKQLENDIAVWENNIGFFSNSKNAESMIADIEKKIEDAKKRIGSLQQRLDILNDLDK